MEKLINLLNEYNEELWKPKRMSGREVRTHRTVVTSSGYWFIRRLVEKDKIEFPTEIMKAADLEWRINYILKYLRISDMPIDFLIYVLK